MGHNPRMRPARLAAKLRQIREHLDLSQNQLIRRLGFEGELIQSNISSYEQEGERGREPPLIVLWAYAKAGNISIESLIDDQHQLKLTGRSTGSSKQVDGKRSMSDSALKGRNRKTAR
jgi:transcriptional regulator with XRE-family HTH domain